MNSRRSFVKKGALAAAAVIAVNPIQSLAGFAPSVYGGQFSNENSFTLLHTADIGSQWNHISDGSAYEGLGGFRSLINVVSEIRKEWKNNILLDAGGMSPDIFGIAADLGYDAINISTGMDDLQAAVKTHHLPVISHHPAHLAQQATPYRIIKKGNCSVGIINANLESGGNNPMIHALETSRFLKNEKDCQVVICLSNLGDNKSKKVGDHALATRSTDIDMIIGSGGGLVSRMPYTCFNKNRQEVVLNYSGYSGLILGKIDFLFNEKGEKIAVHFRNLVIGARENRWKGLPSAELKINS